MKISQYIAMKQISNESFNLFRKEILREMNYVKIVTIVKRIKT